MEYGDNYISEEMLDKLGFVRLDYEDYGRKKVKDVRVNIHGHIFKCDLWFLNILMPMSRKLFLEETFL